MAPQITLKFELFSADGTLVRFLRTVQAVHVIIQMAALLESSWAVGAMERSAVKIRFGGNFQLFLLVLMGKAHRIGDFSQLGELLSVSILDVGLDRKDGLERLAADATHERSDFACVQLVDRLLMSLLHLGGYKRLPAHAADAVDFSPVV